MQQFLKLLLTIEETNDFWVLLELRIPPQSRYGVNKKVIPSPVLNLLLFIFSEPSLVIISHETKLKDLFS